MSGDNPKPQTMAGALAKIGLAGSTRHVFFCMHGDCAPKEVSEDLLIRADVGAGCEFRADYRGQCGLRDNFSDVPNHGNGCGLVLGIGKIAGSHVWGDIRVR